MKILIPIFKFGVQGGSRVLSELANHWIKNGHTVEFLAFAKSTMPNFPTEAKILWYDSNGNILSNNDLTLKNPVFKLFSLVFALTQAINQQTYDVILANQCIIAYPVYLSKKSKKKFYYIQAYEPEYFLGNSLKMIILRRLSKLTYKLNLNKIVNSPIYFDYKEIKCEKFVYPGIDFQKFKPSQALKTGSFIIGCIGRIEPFKGTTYVLDAFIKLQSQVDFNIELHIGFGDKNFENIEGVKVISIKDDYELANYYKSLDALIAPGTLQLGAVHYPVIEAMACKIPVITTGYYPANISNAWIVPIKNSDAIVERLKEIYDNPVARNLKVEMAYLAIKEFDWEIVSNKMLNYFN